MDNSGSRCLFTMPDIGNDGGSCIVNSEACGISWYQHDKKHIFLSRDRRQRAAYDMSGQSSKIRRMATELCGEVVWIVSGNSNGHHR